LHIIYFCVLSIPVLANKDVHYARLADINSVDALKTPTQAVRRSTNVIKHVAPGTTACTCPVRCGSTTTKPSHADRTRRWCYSSTA